MAGFLKKLFSKDDNSPVICDYNTIPSDLESEENGVSASLNDAAKRSRGIISRALKDVAAVADNFMNLKVDSDAELNARVKSVVERSLPQFAAALRKTVPDESSFPEDPQEYYNAVAETLKSVTKCIRGQGRYVIAAFPEEMKELKGHIDVIGREINSMNGTFRPALEKTARIDAVSKSYERCRDIAERHGALLEENMRLEKEIADSEPELSEIERSISELKDSSEYGNYEAAIAGKTAAGEEFVRIADSLHLITANLGNVLRKVSYAAEKDGAKELVKDIARFEAALNAYDLSAEEKEDASEIETLWSPLYSAVAGYVRDNPSFIKTKSEERLLTDDGALISEISGLRKSYAAQKQSLSEHVLKIESSDAAKRLAELSSRRTELKENLERSKNTIASNKDAVAGLEAEYPSACDKLTEALSNLKGKPVQLENLPQLPQ
jgi:hypothetical protein